MARHFIVNFCGKKSAAYRVETGVPQGSVFDPVLFNIFINNIPKSRKSGFAVYANDTRYSHPRGVPPYACVGYKPILMTFCSSLWTGRCQSILINLRR